MGMGHLQSDHADAHARAGHGLLYLSGYVSGKDEYSGEQIFGKVEDIVDFTLRNDERMSFSQGIDVQECQESVVFGNFMGGNFPVDDLGENARHGSAGNIDDFKLYRSRGHLNLRNISERLSEQAFTDG